MAASRRRRPQHTESTITPLRKHRKLLRDGSGSAVWPEHIEHIFLQGLKEYKKSTSSSPSRGRSRWRNQFLVDYLQSKGIDRNKKQVASHIQVLRGMWKGQPEFALVSSLEDDSANERPLSLTQVRAPRSQPLPIVTANLKQSPKFQFPLSPISPDVAPSTTASPVSAHSPTAISQSPKAPVRMRQTSCSSSLSNALGDQGTPPTSTAMISVSPPASYLAYSDSSPPNPPFKVEEMPSNVGILSSFDWNSSPAAVNANAVPLHPEPFMRALPGQNNPAHLSYEFSIYADGLSPFTFTFTPSTSDRCSEGGDVNIHLKLALPPIQDHSRYHPGLNGYRSLIRPLANQAPTGACSNVCGRYETRFYFAGRLDQASIRTGTFSAQASEVHLESDLLASCRWLDDKVDTRITQTVFLPQEGLHVWFVYDLDRSANCPVNARLIQARGCQVVTNDPPQVMEKTIAHVQPVPGDVFNMTMPVLSEIQHMPSALFGDLVCPSTPPNYHGCHYPVSNFSNMAGPPMHMLY